MLHGADNCDAGRSEIQATWTSREVLVCRRDLYQIEQDHRGIKQRYYPVRGFVIFVSAVRFCSVFEEIRRYFRIHPAINKTLPLTQQGQVFLQGWMNLISIWQAI